ncbi:hypothetical protein HYPSUDRAFT_72846 [Hypholoma sublateritium FD-334 SS-4]|uniref:Uncharacterized protein n=1 Tax=Hypholoma sublateritium (strain FD-334 SS-4) TaxID=945553 RepID=A0A0D2LSN1_HYPSF|nr:hypothetical protein HYPSUDRAFT_72846 [Hypholoma sublateritium FD-334 SS-4]
MLTSYHKQFDEDLVVTALLDSDAKVSAAFTFTTRPHDAAPRDPTRVESLRIAALALSTSRGHTSVSRM